MIAILGEAVIDLIGGEGKHDQPCFYHYVGGCALNAATAAARLDAEVLFIGKLSKDMFGKQMADHFAANGVQVVPQFCDVPENSMIVFADIDALGAASYVFFSEQTAVTTLHEQEISDLLDARQDIDYLHIGSVSVALESSGTQIVQALKKRKQLPTIFFDPNVRPTIIEDFSLYRQRVVEQLTQYTIVKL